VDGEAVVAVAVGVDVAPESEGETVGELPVGELPEVSSGDPVAPDEATEEAGSGPPPAVGAPEPEHPVSTAAISPTASTAVT
jgi:hypothetical protein